MMEVVGRLEEQLSEVEGYIEASRELSERVDRIAKVVARHTVELEQFKPQVRHCPNCRKVVSRTAKKCSTCQTEF